ncbi:Phage gp6-like head-tail connector protein [Falsiruegeria litorea R37]|uniref:Phage gp6-like head-tail connector protein n=1 Tax=Falsiruegeria litorea R37 TaxID=1200284 RepID=A0A1Y5SNI1_9RHOB|nr:head-tail connector protein [Falsiruegeria litorea]SLN44716.1 Phage gp6-like head-tail connector protein [Falsiruegeria litorea R37]
MMLIEETTIPVTALPVEQFKAHMRLGSGFADDGGQDAALRGFLVAAIAAIEARIGKVLITREFSWTVNSWRDRAGEVLPVSPVRTVSSLVLSNAVGTETVVAAEDYRLEKDSQRPRLRPDGALLPVIVTGGSAKISFSAGMAVDWGGLPADLGHAVLLLAAHYYEYRDETALSDGCMPFGVTSLIQRYRTMRFGLGAAQ